MQTFRARALTYVTVFIALMSADIARSWVGPTAAPPGNNVQAPINVGVSEQFKPAVLGANILNIYGSNQYLNFGNTTGSAGFGLRNNGGTLEFKASGGSWGALTIAGTGFVGIGTSSPTSAVLEVAGGTNQPLQISTSSAGPWAMTLRRTDLGTTSDVKFFNSGGSLYLPGGALFGGKVGVNMGTTVPGAQFYVMGGSYSGAGGANQAAYALGAQSIASDSTIYSYGRICVGNSWGNCEGTGGVVLMSTGVKFPDGTIQTTAAGGASAGCGAGSVNWTTTNGSGQVIYCTAPVAASVHAQLRLANDTSYTDNSAANGYGSSLVQCINGTWQPVNPTCSIYYPPDPYGGGGLY